MIGYNANPSGDAQRMGSHNIVVGDGHGYTTASGVYASVSGGEQNVAGGTDSSVSGGESNVAGGDNASVSGGKSHPAPGPDDWAAGGLFQDQ